MKTIIRRNTVLLGGAGHPPFGVAASSQVPPGMLTVVVIGLRVCMSSDPKKVSPAAPLPSRPRMVRSSSKSAAAMPLLA